VLWALAILGVVDKHRGAHDFAIQLGEQAAQRYQEFSPSQMATFVSNLNRLAVTPQEEELVQNIVLSFTEYAFGNGTVPRFPQEDIKTWTSFLQSVSSSQGNGGPHDSGFGMPPPRPGPGPKGGGMQGPGNFPPFGGPNMGMPPWAAGPGKGGPMGMMPPQLAAAGCGYGKGCMGDFGKGGMSQPPCSFPGKGCSKGDMQRFPPGARPPFGQMPPQMGGCGMPMPGGPGGGKPGGMMDFSGGAGGPRGPMAPGPRPMRPTTSKGGLPGVAGQRRV